MEKLKISSIIFSLVVLSSCAKRIEKENNIKSAELIKSSVLEVERTHLRRVYNLDWPNPGDEFCCLPAVDCWDDVIVYPKSDSSVEKEFDKFIKANNDNNLIEYFLENNWQELFPYMTETIYLGIIDKRFIISVRPDSKQEGTIIIVVRDFGKNVLAAYPLSLSEK